jgi:uncharacterized membrane protein (DUF106 family)
MDLQLYVWLVALVALVYASTTRLIQRKLVNKKEMEEIQKESKELSRQYKEATKRKDQAEMERIMKKQMEFLPKMNKAMMQQFKPMIVIILLFLAFTYVINLFDPTKQDDITVFLYDDGEGCDEVEGDNIYSGCYNISGENNGKWTYTAVALNHGSEVGSNQTYFFYGYRDTDTYVENGKGTQVILSTDKQLYQPGDEVHLYAAVPPDVTGVSATLDNGTWFYVDLPFTLPVFNVKRIYQPYWWFILISVVLGLIISFMLGRIKK